MKQAKTRRMYYIDILEAAAIFCVIFYHVFSTSVDVREYQHIGAYYIKSCLCISIPLFLVANGGLLFSKEFQLKKHIRKMFHLIFLVCFWDIFNVTVKMFAYHEPLSVSEYIHKLWNFESGWSNQLWYLMALFVLYVFFPLLKCAFDRDKKIFYFFTVIIFIVVFGNSVLNMLLQIGYVLIGRSAPFDAKDFLNQFNPVRGLYAYTFAYFILGSFLIPHVDAIKEKIKPLFAIAGYLLSIALLTFYGVVISANAQEVWDTVSAAFPTVFVLAATFCFFRLSLLCSETSESRIRSIIQTISQNSLGIYLFQSMLADICFTYYRTLPIAGNIIGDFVFALFLLAVCSVLTSLFKEIPYVKYICTL